MKYIVLALFALVAVGCQPTMTPEDEEGTPVDGNKTAPAAPAAPAADESKEGNASE